MGRRTYEDYSSFSAGESTWFAKDKDSRIRCNGIVMNGDFRTDILTVNGSKGLGRRGHHAGAPRVLRLIGLPRIFLPPRI